MDNIFVERYMNYVNKTPLTRKLEDSIFKYINMYNKIQQLHALYFKNLVMVDTAFVQSLDNYKDDIYELKHAHKQLVQNIKSELLSYYSFTHRLTAVLRDIYTSVNSLSQLKHRFLEQSILSTKEKIEIMYHLVNNAEYKKLVTELLMNLKEFDKLSQKRNLHCNHVMLLIDAVKTCEEDLVSNFDVNKYDLMASISNPKFINYIEAQLSFHNNLMADLTGLETALKTKAFPELWEVISEFKREHRVDPNYAIEDVSEGSFRSTFQRYLKLNKAIDTTLGSLKQELADLDNVHAVHTVANPAGLVSPNYALNKGKPIAIKRGWQWRHPKIVKMVAERDLLSDILQQKRLVKLPLVTKEVEFCISEGDSELGWCKKQAGGGKKRSRSKSKGRGKGKKSTVVTKKAKKLIQGYLDYSQLLNALSANKAKYARVLTELYQVRDALNKNEYINALDDAVNQLQNQANRVRLQKILAASKEADYQEYIRKLTEDNPTLAKLAEKNRYASFIMKKGKASQEEYFDELDANNMDNFNIRSKQIMESAHNDNLLKDSVKSMIKQAFDKYSGQSVFDLASTDNRYLEAPKSRSFFLGGAKAGQEGGEFGHSNLNPVVFNPFSLVKDTDRCLQIMKSAKEEIVDELKTAIKLRYNGDELKRYLAKVDIIANRIMEIMNKDRCNIPYAPTLVAELTERYVKLGCTIRCMHLDALHAANLKGGLIGRQVHHCIGVVVKRLIDVECQRLALCAQEAKLLGKDAPPELASTIENCILEPLTKLGDPFIPFLKKDGELYYVNNDLLGNWSQMFGFNISDIRDNKYSKKQPRDLIYLIKDLETILKRVAWGVRDHSDRSQKHAVMSAMRKEKIEKCCSRAHKYAKAFISKKTAQDFFKHQKLYKKDKDLLEKRVKLYQAYASDAIASIKRIAHENPEVLANVILDVHDPTARGLDLNTQYGLAVQDLHDMFELNVSDDKKDKTFVRLYTYHIKNREAPLDQVLQEGDLEVFSELFDKLDNILRSGQPGQPHWEAKEVAQKKVEDLKKPLEGWDAGQPIPVVLCNVAELIRGANIERYKLDSQREEKRLSEFYKNLNVKVKEDGPRYKEGHASDIERYLDAYERTQNTSRDEHADCARSTYEIAKMAKIGVEVLRSLMEIFRHCNRAVICLVNVMMPKSRQITCAKATVGTNMNISSMVELGRRLNAVANEDKNTEMMLSCNEMVSEIQSLYSGWSANMESVKQALADYRDAAAAVTKREEEVVKKDNLLDYVENGLDLKGLGDVLKLKKAKQDAEDVLRMRMHKLEREANEHHRNISKSFKRYIKIVSKETDHVALMAEVMRFIELWNKCYNNASNGGDAHDDPVANLFGRIGGVDNIIKCVYTEINKYATCNQFGEDFNFNNIAKEIADFLQDDKLVTMMEWVESKKDMEDASDVMYLGGGRRRRRVKRKAKRKAGKRKAKRRVRKASTRRRVVKRKAPKRKAKRRMVRRRRR